SAASLVAGPLGQVLAVGVSSRRKRNPGTGELLREFSVLNGRPRQRKADVIHGVRYVDAVHGTVATAVGCARYLPQIFPNGSPTLLRLAIRHGVSAAAEGGVGV